MIGGVQHTVPSSTVRPAGPVEPRRLSASAARLQAPHRGRADVHTRALSNTGAAKLAQSADLINVPLRADAVIASARPPYSLREMKALHNKALSMHLDYASPDYLPEQALHWVGKYRRLAAKEGTPNVYSPDLAKELFEDFNRGEVDASVVHEASYSVSHTGFMHHVGRSDTTDAVLLGGGCGAGKTTSLRSILSQPDLADAPVLDGTLSWRPAVIKTIDEVIEQGKRVQIYLVYRDPKEAAQGVVERALRTKRTIPSDRFATSHLWSAKNVVEVAERYAHNSRVRVNVLHNSSASSDREPIAETIDFLKKIILAHGTHEEFVRKSFVWFDEAFRKLDHAHTLQSDQRALIRHGLGLDLAVA